MEKSTNKNKMVSSTKFPGIQLYYKANGDITYYACYEDHKKLDKSGKAIKVRVKIGHKSEGITLQFAKAKRDEIVTKLRLGEIPELLQRKRQKEVFTFNNLADLYFEARQKNNGSSNVKNINNDKSIVKNHLIKLCNLSIDSIREEDIEKLKLTKLKEKSPKTINNILTVLSAILNYGITIGKLSSIPNIKKIGGIDNARERYFSKEEIKLILESIKSNRILNLFVRLSLSTGGRLETIRAIKVKDINLNSGTILLTDLKAKAARKKNITYIGYIMNHLKEDLAEIIINQEPNAYIFRYENGMRVSIDYIQNNLQKLFNKLFNKGLEKNDTKNRAVVHTLRHTFASQLAITGTPIFTIQRLMNHSDINMTLRYAKLSPENGKEAINKMDIF